MPRKGTDSRNSAWEPAEWRSRAISRGSIRDLSAYTRLTKGQRIVRMNSVNPAVTRFAVLLFLTSAASMLRADVIQLDPQSVSAFGFQTTGVINPVVNYTVGG